METKRKEFAAWFKRRRGPRNPQAEEAILAIADAYDSMQQEGQLSDKQLQLIVNGASSSDQLTWDCATTLLRKIVERWPIAAKEIIAMSQNSEPHVRFAAICSLGKNVPTAISDSVLKSALVDESSHVRSKAAERANSLEQRHLVPNITAALEAEQDAKARKSIELNLRMLRDGHWLESGADGQKSITVRTPDGITSKSVTDEEFRMKGIDRIVEELRE